MTDKNKFKVVDPWLIQDMAQAIKDIKDIGKRLRWTGGFSANGRLWLAEGRKIRAEYGLTDKNVLDIANRILDIYNNQEQGEK